MKSQEMRVGNIFKVLNSLLSLSKDDNFLISICLNVTLYMLEHLALILHKDSFVRDSLRHLVNIVTSQTDEDGSFSLSAASLSAASLSAASFWIKAGTVAEKSCYGYPEANSSGSLRYLAQSQCQASCRLRPRFCIKPCLTVGFHFRVSRPIFWECKPRFLVSFF
jgi:hypothetical protein